MSDEEQRRSMDDVLSSIRRIMRPEKTVREAEDATPGEAARPAEGDAGGPARPAEERVEPSARLQPDDAEEPLALTDMIASPEPAGAAAEPALDAGADAGAGLAPTDGTMRETAGDDLAPGAAEPADEELGGAAEPSGAAAGRHWSEEPVARGHWSGEPATRRHWGGEPASRRDPVEEPALPAPRTEHLPEPAEREGGGALMIDEGALEDMIRRVIRAELVEGEIGRNISENVQRLIEEEVRRALRERG